MAGAGLVALGLIIMGLARLTGGRGAPLPGDIVIRRDGLTVYFPIVTMILISAVLTLLLRIIASLRR